MIVRNPLFFKQSSVPRERVLQRGVDVNSVAARRANLVIPAALLVAVSLLLSACGGGGAASLPPSNTGSLAITPASANLYAGVPYELNIVGGRKPYLVTSNEQTVIALNRTVDANVVTIVAENPGVIDPGSATEVPRRSVTISVRDSLGATTTAQLTVLQNFFTGYRQTYSNTCSTSGTTGTIDACAGTDSLVQLVPVSQGLLYANRELRLDRIRGDFSFVNEDPAAAPQTTNRLLVRTDSTGRAFARLRVAGLAPSQLATYSITDVASGASTTVAFLIVGVSVTEPNLAIIPAGPITLVGRLNTLCGAGTADIFIVGGRPPYVIGAPTGVSTFPPSPLPSSGSRLSITIPASETPCPPPFTILVTDSRGNTAQFTINAVAGTLEAEPTPPPVVIAPSALPGTAPALRCGQSAQVAVIGGSTRASLSLRSTHPRVNAVISGQTLSVQRLAGDGGTAYPDSFTVTVTDGSSTAELAGTTATTCP